MSDVTYIITATISMGQSLFAFAEPLINPLDADATVLTYLIDLGVVLPICFAVFGRLIGMVRR